MKKINVIDLDKTLIPYDSFRRYFFLCIRPKNFFPALAIIVLRKFRLIRMDVFKKRIIALYRNNNDYKSAMTDFADKLYKSINVHVLETINSHTDSQTINVLISASPYDYVNEFCRKVEWSGIASTLQGNDFLHIYGQNKINILKSMYDQKQYNYNFAISDHDSDDDLLSLFKIKAKFVNNRVVYQ